MSDYVISDTHFGHANVIEYESRPFANVEVMNAELIRRWNETVNVDDTVYILGDFCWKPKMVRDINPQLKGKKVLILGNHDSTRNLPGFEAIHKFGLDLKDVSLCHYPMTEHRRHFSMHGHLHRVDCVFNSSKRSRRVYVRANMCVENWDYRPVLMDDVLEHMKEVRDDDRSNGSWDQRIISRV